MLIFFVSMFACVLYKLFVNFDYYYFDDINLSISLVDLEKFCNNTSSTFMITKYLHVLQDHCQIVNIILIWIMIKLKSSQDILQGVSKLNNLIKTSIF